MNYFVYTLLTAAAANHKALKHTLSQSEGESSFTPSNPFNYMPAGYKPSSGNCKQ